MVRRRGLRGRGTRGHRLYGESADRGGGRRAEGGGREGGRGRESGSITSVINSARAFYAKRRFGGESESERARERERERGG
jgi:hypothetical protein